MAKKSAPDRGPTILDIAHAAGVSKSTVSLVLKHSPLIVPTTSAKVLKAAQDLGYVYNRSAANLRQKNSNVVGVIVNDLTNPFFVELLIGAERNLLQSGYIALVAHTAENLVVQDQVLAAMREQGAAGVILCPAYDTPNDLPSLIHSWNLPLVVVVRPIDAAGSDYVGTDNELGARLATNHLIELGHRDIAFMGHGKGYSVGELRKAGYIASMKQHGLKVRKECIVDVPVSMNGGAEGIDLLTALRVTPTAVVCYNDVMAMGAVHELDRMGLRAGRDISITGFDDVASAAHTNPPLTTVAIHPMRQGEIASGMLLERIKNPEATWNQYLTEPRLVIRDSSGPVQTVCNPD